MPDPAARDSNLRQWSETVKLYFLSAILTALVFAPGALGETAPDPVVVKNELILQSGPEVYTSVRHIVLRGSNEEIGRALGEIARREYGAELVRYADPAYAAARREYMRLNYPIQLERMKGVARAYGLDLEKTDYDTSNLYFGTSGPRCSAIFFPAAVSAGGNNFYVSNRDYYLGSVSEVMGEERKPGEGDILDRLFVIELYPDRGYPSIGIGSLDLLNMQIDGVNSAGLAVASLEDDTFGMERTFKDLSRQSGLHQYQLSRLILDTCATLEEARQVILNNKMTMVGMPAHFIVMDASGRSFIFERNAEDSSDCFIFNEGRPQIITNHSVCAYPALEKFPPPAENDYDTFNRFRRLEEYVRLHQGKFSEDHGREAMSLVYGRVDEADEGGYHDLPLRTLYTTVVDIDSRAVEVKFYTRDGRTDPETGLTEPLFSRPFRFSLSPGVPAGSEPSPELPE